MYILHGGVLMYNNNAALPARQSGPDLVRCAGFLLVVLFHFYLFNYFYSVPQTGFPVFAADVFRTLSISCNGLFMMLTGYLYCEKPLKKGYFRGLFRVALLYALFAAVSIPVRHFWLGDTQSPAEWARRFFGFSGVYYGWYVKMYAGLMLLSPLLSAAAGRLREENRLLFCVGLCAAATSLPLLTSYPILPDWWTGFYPVTYYMLGACFRKYQPRIPAWAAFGGAALLAALLGAVTFFSADGPLSETVQYTFGDIRVMPIAVLLFAGLYRLRVRGLPARAIAFFADGTYGGYLISHLFDASLYRRVRPLCVPEKYPLLFLLVGLPIFIVSCLIGAAAHRGVERLAGRG